MSHPQKSVEEILKERRETAILVGRNWVDLALTGFKEPTWKGTWPRKGVSRGFLLPKTKVALLQVLYPLLSSRKIGELAGVNGSVVRVWRSQENFQKEIEQACRAFGTQAGRMIEWEVEGKGSPGLALELKNIGAPEHLAFAELLPFFNPMVLDFVMNYLDKKQDEQERAMDKIDLFTMFRYAEFLRRFSRILFLRKDRNLKTWVQNSSFITLVRKEIDFLVNFLASLAVHKIGTEEQIQTIGTRLKNLIFETIEDLRIGAE